MKKSTKGARQALKRYKDTAKRGHKQGKDPKINPAPSAQALESRQRHSEGMLLMSGNGNVMCAASPAARAQPLAADWTHRHAADGACVPQRRRPPAPPQGRLIAATENGTQATARTGRGGQAAARGGRGTGRAAGRANKGSGTDIYGERLTSSGTDTYGIYKGKFYPVILNGEPRTIYKAEFRFVNPNATEPTRSGRRAGAAQRDAAKNADWTHRHAADGACMPQRRRPPAPPKGAVNSGRRERHAGNGEDAAGRPGGGRRGGSLQCPCCAPAAGGGGCV